MKQITQLNLCMKLKIHNDSVAEARRLTTRFKDAVNAALQMNHNNIYHLRITNDYRTDFNEFAKSMHHVVQQQGCPEAHWGRHYAALNPVKEWVKTRSKIFKKNGKRIGRPTYKKLATYYTVDDPGIVLSDLPLTVHLPSEMMDSRQPRCEPDNIIGGRAKSGNFLWSSLKLVDTPKTRKNMKRFEGMKISSAILFEDHKGDFQISFSMTKKASEPVHSNYIGVDVGATVHATMTRLSVAGEPLVSWEFHKISKDNSEELARYAKTTGCAVVLEKLPSGSDNMKFTGYSPAQIQKEIIQACLKIDAPIYQVPAKNTSKRCSSCGHIHTPAQFKLATKTGWKNFICISCKTALDRDYNSTLNIAQRAMGVWN